jgi:hypothetical protein
MRIKRRKNETLLKWLERAMHRYLDKGKSTDALWIAELINRINAGRKAKSHEHEEFRGYLNDDGSADYSDGWSLRDDGRNDDGTGESYAERNR